MKEQTEKPPMRKKDAPETPQHPQGQQQNVSHPGGQPSSQAMQENGEQEGHQQGMSRRDWFTPSAWTENPFALMRRFSNEMERFFEDVGFGRGWLGSRLGQGRGLGRNMWAPQIEICEHDNQLVVCADLPGLKKEDIKVEFSDNVLTIQGERQQEHEESHEGYRTSERSYGSFYRSIPLPEGVNPENAKATFQDGVLKITLPLPQHQKPWSQRIEIQESSDQPSRGQTKMSEQTPRQ